MYGTDFSGEIVGVSDSIDAVIALHQHTSVEQLQSAVDHYIDSHAICLDTATKPYTAQVSAWQQATYDPYGYAKSGVALNA